MREESRVRTDRGVVQVGQSVRIESRLPRSFGLDYAPMCGIVGFLDRSGSGAAAPVGSILLGMLKSLDCRGPDSAGVAIFGRTRRPDLKLRIKLNGEGNARDSVARVRRIVSRRLPVLEEAVVHEYLQLLVVPVDNASSLLSRLEQDLEGFELVSGGRQLEIVKQVGSPTHLDTGYAVSELTGTHGIGHTRLSTESRDAGRMPGRLLLRARS